MRHASLTISLLFLLALVPRSNAIAQIETLVMPGDVITGHAEVEAECSSCHVAFQRKQQKVLCMNCHEDISQDISAGTGYHGTSKDVADAACASCHTDHEGRDADIVNLNTRTFNHDLTNFELLGEHRKTDCADCHVADTRYREAPSECIDCHRSDDDHAGSLGSACADCHSPVSWQEAIFDHDTTEFSLLGKHLEATCLNCHADATFEPISTGCFSCHADDDVHNGRSGENCGNCHNSTDWSDTSFDHQRDTHFALSSSHGLLECGDCHSPEPFNDGLGTACIDCHRADDSHGGHFGDSCESCHAADEWTVNSFDHLADTGHALFGAHSKLECTDCHVEPLYNVVLGAGCNDCHGDDDPHKGTLGAACADCHNETSWTEQVFFDHDLSLFPLLGQHANASCDACHESSRFHDASSACADCHASEDPHGGRFAGDCGACHNPVSWDHWLFDHDTQTEFMLEGAHIAVGCNGCHRQSASKQSELGARCSDCHRSDDVHNGEFGADCGRCHSQENFLDVRIIQ